MPPFLKPFFRHRFGAIAVATAGLALAACSQHAAPTPAASPGVASAKTSSAPTDLQLFFNENSDALSADASQKLDAAARLYREGSPAVMFVTGHADTSGSEYPNLLLSGRRAKAAKDGLVARGIPADRLQLQALGSSLPRDPNSSAPQDNRRVVITWR